MAVVLPGLGLFTVDPIDKYSGTPLVQPLEMRTSPYQGHLAMSLTTSTELHVHHLK